MQTGPEQLRAWIHRRFGGNQTHAVEFLDIPGIDTTVLSKILSGARPIQSLGKALAIQAKTGIPPAAWASTEQDESETAAVAGTRKRR